MRTLLLVGLVAMLLTATNGCSSVTDTPEEIKATQKQMYDLDARQMTDDWNYFWLVDRPYRLTRWHMR